MRSAAAGRPAARRCLSRSYPCLRVVVAGSYERQQALVILPTGGAALQVRLHAGHRAAVDELVEAVEALLAADLGFRGAEQAHRSPPIAARSLRRASCRVLYSAPRLLPSRSASTSIGTPLSASAVKTWRWYGVSAVRIASRTARSSSASSRRWCGDGATSAGIVSSRGTSRSRHACRRAFTPASSSANL